MKKIICLILALSFVFSLTACNKNNNGGDNTELSVLLDTAVTAFGFEDDIQAGIDEMKKSVDDGYIEDTPSQRMIIKNTEMLRDWAKEKEIIINSKNWGWADSLTNKLQSAFLAQDTPDVINGEAQMPGFAQKGYLQPFPDERANWVKENCLSVAYSGMTFNGKIYGISLSPGMTILMWNKNMLRECGISEAVVKNGPKDWAEWEATMQEVKAKGKNAGGVYTGAGDVNYGAFLRSGTLLVSAGGGYADSNGGPQVSAQANIEAYEFIRRMASYNKPGMLNATSEDAYFSQFRTGNMAYYVDGTWAIHDAQRLDFETGYCIMPNKDGSGDGATVMIGCVYLSVPIYAKNTELAWELIKFLLSADVQTNLAKGGLRFPVLTSASQTVYTDTASEYYKSYFSAYKQLTEYATNKDVKGLPAFAMNNGKLSSLWGAVGGLLGRLADNKNTTQVSVLANDAQNAMMKEWNKG